MKSEGNYKKYTPGLGLISIVAQFQIKSCNTMKRFCDIMISVYITQKSALSPKFAEPRARFVRGALSNKS